MTSHPLFSRKAPSARTGTPDNWGCVDTIPGDRLLDCLEKQKEKQRFVGSLNISITRPCGPDVGLRPYDKQRLECGLGGTDGSAVDAGNKSVEKLLAGRPNREEWRLGKAQFHACLTGRKKWFSRLYRRFTLLTIFSTCLFWGALILTESSFVLGLVLIMFASTIGAAIPVLAWMEDYIVSPEKLAEMDALSARNKIFRLVFKKMLLQNPLPKPVGLPDVHTLLEADESKHGRTELQSFTTSPSAVAYLRGVSTQDVPLLVSDVGILEALFNRDKQAGLTHSLPETNIDYLTSTPENLAGGFA